jgi:hypothetical protein
VARPSGREQIPFGDLVLDMEMQIGEGAPEHSSQLFPALAGWEDPGRCAMVHKVWSDHFVIDVQIPLVEPFFNKMDRVTSNVPHMGRRNPAL